MDSPAITPLMGPRPPPTGEPLAPLQEPSAPPADVRRALVPLAPAAEARPSPALAPSAPPAGALGEPLRAPPPLQVPTEMTVSTIGVPAPPVVGEEQEPPTPLAKLERVASRLSVAPEAPLSVPYKEPTATRTSDEVLVDTNLLINAYLQIGVIETAACLFTYFLTFWVFGIHNLGSLVSTAKTYFLSSTDQDFHTGEQVYVAFAAFSPAA